MKIVLFAVLLASGLVMGGGPGNEPTEGATASSHDTAARTVGTVKAPDGVEIRYEAAGSGEPVLVFIHGWSCDRSYWSAQVNHFAASHRVVAVDLGGHGQSGLGRKDWTMTAFAGDVRAVVEALGLRKVVLVGRSDPKLVEWIARDMAAGPAAVGLSAMEHIRRYDEGAALAAVRVPVRMINADLFPTNLEAARRRKPDVSLAVMPGGSRPGDRAWRAR